jgi:hypothetical protein
MRIHISVAVTALLAVAATGEIPRFTHIPRTVRSMNVDGTIVTFNAPYGGNASVGMRYSLTDGTTTPITNPPYNTSITGISSTGQYFSGSSLSGSPTSTQAHRFADDGDHVLIGKLPGTANSYTRAISDDGRVVVGHSDLYSQTPGVITYPFRWTPQTGRQEIGPANGLGGGEVEDLSRDGSTIVGNSSGGAWVWREIGGFSYLPTLVPNRNASAKAVSADGTIIVGTVHIEDNSLARRLARWIGSDIQVIQQSDYFESPVAEDVSDDGGTIVGSIRISGSAPTWGMICTPEFGIMLAHDYLSMHGLNIPAGVQIDRVFTVSADGLTFGGWLRDGSGFVATVPAPASAALFAAAGLFAARRRRG